MTPRLLSSSSINGTNIYNYEGESIGEIKDLMIDYEHGRVAYAVLSFGGFLSIGEKLFAIPLESFQFDSEGLKGKIILDISEESLENAPGFDKDNWPQNPDYSFMDKVYNHYNTPTYWEYETV